MAARPEAQLVLRAPTSPCVSAERGPPRTLRHEVRDSAIAVRDDNVRTEGVLALKRCAQKKPNLPRPHRPQIPRHHFFATRRTGNIRRQNMAAGLVAMADLGFGLAVNGGSAPFAQHQHHAIDRKSVV